MPEPTSSDRIIAITLRSAPILDKPKPKPKSDAKWNPETQQLDYPPTKRQVMFLRDLCLKQRVAYVRPKTKREAVSAIDKLVRARKAERGRATVTNRLP